MKQQGILLLYGRVLQAQQMGGRVLMAAPEPAANVQDEDDGGGGHYRRRTAIVIALIVLATLALLAALLYRQRKAKTQQQALSEDSKRKNQITRSAIHSTTQDSTITLNGKSTIQTFACKRQIGTLAPPTTQKEDFMHYNDEKVKHDHAPPQSFPFDSRKLTTLQQGWPIFDMDQLLKSSAQPLVGMGVFGSAYKVTYNGLPTIVIRHLQGVNISYQEFKNRIGDLAKLNHVNVLPIMAYYFSEAEKILLYEHLSFGNLATHLHNKDKEGWAPLEWPKRMQVAMEVAQGVAHIHGKGSNKGLVHGNIKPANVLLRPNGTACLADTGLAHLVRACPAALNVGYRAPEVTHMNPSLTYKSDVYSYGVLLLELLTAKEPVSPSSNHVLDLPRLIRSSIQEEWTAEIFDPKIPLQAHYEEEMVLMLKIAMECVQVTPRDRPSMSRVVGMIKSMREFDNPSGSTYSDEVSTPHDQFDVV